MGAPLYISEIAPPNSRGSLMVLEAISFDAYWIPYGTRAMRGDWAFRLPFLLQMIPAQIPLGIETKKVSMYSLVSVDFLYLMKRLSWNGRAFLQKTDSMKPITLNLRPSRRT
ncbi:hypothetical protein N7499_000846 [Penicillium canescens]|uniref:Uncharacterized protein n=1 Tax=Penicillium canescens TaxID=5083 RepID=A0AAD6IIS6_PENCN|nr:hypothetical protein N7444_012686 [Penicillium canescens]KAJ6048131.1 hypothetical protein N7460_004278 [Penicillium canescens]KAJ6101216.1 hypothetical protein N7499_000846 [Penicillium canescens]KAJ6173674.1 hypothetical protein N7485_006486 [Penicillium canescens]